MSRIVTFIILCLVGWGVFHFGGWHLALDKKVSAIEQLLRKGARSDTEILETLFLNKQSDVILDKRSVLVRIDKSYYGFVRDKRFFDSPVIQWAMLFGAFCFWWQALGALFRGDDENEKKENDSEEA